MNKIVILLLIVLVQCKSTEKNVSTASLENTYWRLDEMNGESFVPPTDAKEAHIILTTVNTEKRVKGFAGCNNMGGGFI